VLPILIPLVSPKSYAKLHTVPSLLGLARRGVSLAGIDLPLATLMEEARVLREDPNAANPHANAYGHAAGVLHAPAAGWWGSVTSLLPWGEAPVALPAAALDDKVTVAAADTPYWSEDIDVIVERDEGRVPRALRDLTSAILLHCTSTEGIFRRSAYVSKLDLIDKSQVRDS
jgi:hypothetical protein